MNKIVGLLAVLITYAASPITAQSPAPSPQDCAALRNLRLPGVAMSEISAEWIPAGPAPSPFAPPPATTVLPAYCRLQGTLNRRQGADGQSYGIGFALALPATWNGRFLFQGGGGFNGVLAPPYGVAAAGGTPALARGFAVVSTDSGHRSPGGNALDTAFLADQQATMDFAYQAVDRVTTVAKAIIAQHYAQPISRSYYSGCSTGGREAMLAAQRYPLEFDGVIAGAPNMRINYAVLGLDWVNVQLNQVAPRGTNGQPVTREALSSTQKEAVIAGIRNACDANDGVRDGLVFNTSACKFDPETLVCGGKNSGAGCLTAAQAAALERAFAGPRMTDGRQLYSPFPFDTGIADGAQQIIPGLLYGGFNGSSASTTDLDAAARWADGNGPSAVTDTFGWTNMTTFANRGGKMIFFHGVSDPTFSALDTVNYYNRLGAANGGADAVQRWSRLFLVPGMGHCGGGSLATDSFDLLTALVDWVERNVPPDAVVAARRGEPRLTRPLCAYPRYAHYSGRGDPNDAASFVCRAAQTPTDDLYLANANLVDPATREVRRGNLLIRNGMIVSAPGKPPAGFTGRTLDLNGKWVIPGLIDLHAHTYGNVDTSGKPIDRPNTPGVAVRMLYAGVTAFLDLFGNEDELFNWRDEQRAGVLGGADLFASLTCLTATGAHGTEYGVKARITDSPEEARRAVESLKSRRPDVIKIIYELGSGRRSIDKATLLAAVSAARQNGIKTVVHVSTWQDVRDAVEAGATAVTHVPGQPIPMDVARLMAARKVASIPTLAVQTDFLDFVYTPDVLDNPMARALTTPPVIGAYRSADLVARADGFRATAEATRKVVLGSVKTMADAGVQILAGTDSGSVGTLQGYSVHRELIKLVAAGLSPWQALAAATTEAGAFLGRAYGVKPGSEATLVVLDASPIADIRNTQRIAYVIHHGTVVDREGLITSKVAGLN